MKSINNPWAISDKYRARYGEVWSNLDFVFEDKISEDVFRADPMNSVIGQLHIFNQTLKMTYKDLINYAKLVKTQSDESYVSGTKTDVFDIRLKAQTFTLQRHELCKLSETLNEASVSALKAYELGLYL
jgi:hypothetical protein